MRVSIFNYGVGNLFSLQAALKREGARPQVTRDIHKVKSSDALLLPGVGNFSEAARKLPTEVRELAQTGKPILGVCLGLQLFFKESEEGKGKGLAIIPGKVKRLPSTSVKVPQIGWNTLTIKNPDNEYTRELPDNPWVYYVHSYYPSTQGPWVIATSEYGVEYPSIIAKKNILGTQFHPEKSGRTGRTILRNFLQTIRK